MSEQFNPTGVENNSKSNLLNQLAPIAISFGLALYPNLATMASQPESSTESLKQGLQNDLTLSKPVEIAQRSNIFCKIPSILGGPKNIVNVNEAKKTIFLKKEEYSTERFGNLTFTFFRYSDDEISVWMSLGTGQAHDCAGNNANIVFKDGDKILKNVQVRRRSDHTEHNQNKLEVRAGRIKSNPVQKEVRFFGNFNFRIEDHSKGFEIQVKPN